jgi:hypothetical protein
MRQPFAAWISTPSKPADRPWHGGRHRIAKDRPGRGRISRILTMMKATTCLILGLALAAGAAIGESAAERDARMAWFREARFGMFIHWGVYAVPPGEWAGKKYGGGVEWIQSQAKIPVAEYTPLKDRFNPVKYDADAWVRLAKDAGMKYIVITSKHHDGFCLWDSAHTDWDIASTPYKNDLLKPLAEACRRHGLTLCFYHSIMDWHHPDYGDKAEWRGNAANPAPDMDKYTAYMKAQLKELLEGYGPLGVLWFDGEWEKSWTHERGKDLYDYVRSLQPSIIVNNRVDKGRRGMEGFTAGGEFRGDFGTPEQEIPATGLPGVDWESCMTMNDTWGFSAHDQLEIRRDPHSQPHRHRLQGRQLPAQRRPHRRGRNPRSQHPAAAGHRHLDAGQWRVHPRQPGQPVPAHALGTLHRQGW